MALPAAIDGVKKVAFDPIPPTGSRSDARQRRSGRGGEGGSGSRVQAVGGEAREENRGLHNMNGLILYPLPTLLAPTLTLCPKYNPRIKSDSIILAQKNSKKNPT
jgi:hypothetical protein